MQIGSDLFHLQLAPPSHSGIHLEARDKGGSVEIGPENSAGGCFKTKPGCDLALHFVLRMKGNIQRREVALSVI